MMLCLEEHGTSNTKKLIKTVLASNNTNDANDTNDDINDNNKNEK